MGSRRHHDCEGGIGPAHRHRGVHLRCSHQAPHRRARRNQDRRGTTVGLHQIQSYRAEQEPRTQMDGSRIGVVCSMVGLTTGLSNTDGCGARMVTSSISPQVLPCKASSCWPNHEPLLLKPFVTTGPREAATTMHTSAQVHGPSPQTRGDAVSRSGPRQDCDDQDQKRDCGRSPCAELQFGVAFQAEPTHRRWTRRRPPTRPGAAPKFQRHPPTHPVTANAPSTTPAEQPRRSGRSACYWSAPGPRQQPPGPARCIAGRLRSIRTQQEAYDRQTE